MQTGDNDIAKEVYEQEKKNLEQELSNTKWDLENMNKKNKKSADSGSNTRFSNLITIFVCAAISIYGLLH